MRIFGAAILAASLLVTNAYAATLPAGKPAGVKKAQEMGDNAILIIAGIALAGVGIGLALSADNAHGPTAVTTGTP